MNSKSSSAPATQRRNAAHAASEELEKLLSNTAVSTEQTRSTNFTKARERAKRVNRDKEIAQFEYEEKHRHHH